MLQLLLRIRFFFCLFYRTRLHFFNVFLFEIMNQHRIVINTIIEDAKKFLIQNSIEKKITMIRIFNIKFTTLNSFINRDSKSKSRKKHNKIMIDEKKKFFIISYVRC